MLGRAEGAVGVGISARRRGALAEGAMEGTAFGEGGRDWRGQRSEVKQDDHEAWTQPLLWGAPVSMGRRGAGRPST